MFGMCGDVARVEQDAEKQNRYVHDLDVALLSQTHAVNDNRE